MIRLGEVDWSEYRQSELAECGLMCLAAGSALLGQHVSAAEARRNYSGSLRGTSLSGLGQLAEAFGLTAEGVDCEASELPGLPLPAILHWRDCHFVLLTRATRVSVDVFDPAAGNRRYSVEEATEFFGCKALAIGKGAGFKESGKRALNLAPLRDVTIGLGSSIGMLLLLSLLVQAAALMLPLMSQLAINRGALEGNVPAVVTIASCMAVVYLASFCTEVWRAFVNQRLSTHVTLWTSRKLFRHMLSLPISWLERRGAADLATRFDSVDPLRSAVSSGVATLAIDGILSLVLVTVMIALSPVMGGVLVGSVALGVASKFAFTPKIASLAGDATAFKIQEQAKRWETVRSIQSIKLSGAEHSRERDWLTKLRAFLWTTERSQRVASIQAATTNLVGGLGSLALLFMGTLMVARGTLSVGALFAFVIYRRYLSDKLSAVVDQLSNFWTLRVHMRRVTEVLEVESEPRWNDLRSDAEPLPAGAVSVQKVVFRHSANDRPVLQGVSLEAGAGELIVIQGPSGVGKSTLLKVICGLYVPTAGSVSFDRVPVSSISPRFLRSRIAAVSQEDEVLAGSVYENVTYLEEVPDLDRCFAALEAAELAIDIKRLPMGIHTQVGEGGRALSAGQRQRLLIARAFYRRPRLFLLDECTSNLEPHTEARIFERLRQVRATKIVISHDARVASFGDRVYQLSEQGLNLVSRRLPEVAA